MTNVTFQHPEYAAMRETWDLVDDVCAGERRVKEQGEKYLPKPNPADKSPENTTRYDQYKKRAVFYNATGRTKKGLVGAAFRKVPTVTVSPALDYIKKDIDGRGISVYQQSQKAVGEAVKKGRGGLLVDYPRTSAPVTKAQQDAGEIRATITLIDAKSIINWKTTKVGSKIMLSLVVIHECVTEDDAGGFGQSNIQQYRALTLQDGVYIIELYRKSDKDEWYLYDMIQPLDGAGMPWNVIPFTFFGSENNDASVDESPLYDLASLNLAHYRNSADYEDSVYFVGQAQAYISGLTEEWRDHLQANKIYVGSRAPMLLPVNGQMGFAQPEPNTLVKEAMDAKKQDMVSIGARLVTPGGAVKTATEAQGDRESEMSVLSLCVSNVSEAYTQALVWMARFMNAPTDGIEYVISQDFIEAKLDAQMLLALIQLWQSGKYPEGDFWAQLRKYGIIDPAKTNEMIKGEADSTASGLALTG